MALSFLAYLNHPEERAKLHMRRLARLLILTLMVMVSFFALSPVRRETTDFWRLYGHSGFMPEYRLAFLTYLGAPLADGAYRSWRNASIADHPSLILGLRVVTV